MGFEEFPSLDRGACWLGKTMLAWGTLPAVSHRLIISFVVSSCEPSSFSKATISSGTCQND